ncbi:hypothetical protein EAF00_009141 [Botryotinia globosa]|nr:hypothetical protein EAF00_009141 [Botryotinia globosa]
MTATINEASDRVNVGVGVGAVGVLCAAARIGTAYTQASSVVDAADAAGITDTSGGITHGVDEDAGEVVDTTGMNVGRKGDTRFREDYEVMHCQVMGLVLSLLGLIRSKVYLADPDASIDELLKTTSDTDLATETINGWSGKAIGLVLCGSG